MDNSDKAAKIIKNIYPCGCASCKDDPTCTMCKARGRKAAAAIRTLLTPPIVADNWVAYCRYVQHDHDVVTIETCDQDAPRAFKVYRQPAPSPLLTDLAEQVGRLRKPCPNKDTAKCVSPYADGCPSAPQGFVCHGTGLVPLSPGDLVDLVGMVKVLPECLDELKGMHHLGDCDCPACEAVRRAENVLNGLRVEEGE
jgi:hypothetical protein